MGRFSKAQIESIERVLAMYRRYKKFDRIMAGNLIANLRRIRDEKPV